MPIDKSSALHFLRELERRLSSSLRDTDRLTAALDEAVANRDRVKDPHLFRREAVFVNRYVVPCLYELICAPEYFANDEARARKALRNEHLTGMEKYTEATGAWLEKHPFSKIWPGDPEAVYAQWSAGKGLRDSWPDIAIHDEALPRVVFECKYFVGGSSAAARTAIVQDLYQAVFYRGLPPLPAKGTRAAWSCDYACLIAFDASPSRELLGAWKRLPAQVRDAFWSGAGVYPMFIEAGA